VVFVCKDIHRRPQDRNTKTRFGVGSVVPLRTDTTPA
jgi:hypothetical protein